MLLIVLTDRGDAGGDASSTAAGLAEPDAGSFGVADEHAIVEDDAGWSGAWLQPAALAEIAVQHIHWRLPDRRPALAQGLVAAVPAKLWLQVDGSALLIVATVSVDELQERLA